MAMQMAAVDPARLVVVEAESSKVGNCRLPPGLWKAMVAAPRVSIVAPLTARAAYLARTYGDLSGDAVRLAGLIDLLRGAHSGEGIEGWHGLAAVGKFEALAAGLMEAHYDPRYAKHRARMERVGAEVVVERLGVEDLAGIAARVVAVLSGLAG